jgi:hypothetical protein
MRLWGSDVPGSVANLAEQAELTDYDRRFLTEAAGYYNATWDGSVGTFEPGAEAVRDRIAALLGDSPAGPVLVAPDGSRHRLVVANDGTLSTVLLS